MEPSTGRRRADRAGRRTTGRLWPERRKERQRARHGNANDAHGDEEPNCEKRDSGKRDREKRDREKRDGRRCKNACKIVAGENFAGGLAKVYGEERRLHDLDARQNHDQNQCRADRTG